MGIYEELVARGLIAQVTNEEEIREMINNGKATFYIGLQIFWFYHSFRNITDKVFPAFLTPNAVVPAVQYR